MCQSWLLENKLSLLKAKIEELKFLFSEKPLKELERLKFIIETIDEPTLKDIKIDVNLLRLDY